MNSSIAAFERAFREACAEQILPLEIGTAYLTPAFPKMYDLNVVVVEDADRPLRHLIEAAEPVFSEAHLPHRKLLVDDERHGARLADEARRENGWKVSPIVDMIWEHDPGGPAEKAEEVPLPALREFRERIHRAAYGDEEDLIRQFLERDYVYRRAGNGRFFGVRDDDGNIQCSLNLFRLGEVAEIDDVETAEAAQGRGYGRAAVLAAGRAARRDGAEVVFLCADSDDWPKDWYGRLGFTPAGRRYEFLRTP